MCKYDSENQLHDGNKSNNNNNNNSNNNNNNNNNSNNVDVVKASENNKVKRGFSNLLELGFCGMSERSQGRFYHKHEFRNLSYIT